MAKKKTARRRKPVVQDVEITEVEEDMDSEEPCEQQDSSNDDDHGLTYKKRYTVSLFNPSKSSIGCTVYDDFYETNVLKEAKAEAQKVFNEENLVVAIWDREGMCTPPILYKPEEVKDDSETTEPEKKRGRKPARRNMGNTGGVGGDKPRPKHPRKKS